MQNNCPHEQRILFSAVGRLTDENGKVTNYIFEARIQCLVCKMFFQFLGIEGGMTHTEPRVNFDLTQLRAPITPPANTPKCEHLSFNCHHNSEIIVKENSGLYFGAKAQCAECKTFFEFIGVPDLLSNTAPCCTSDFTQITIPVQPYSDAIAKTAAFQFTTTPQTPKTFIN